MSTLSRLQALLRQLRALEGSGDEHACLALLAQSDSLTAELAAPAWSPSQADAQQWRWGGRRRR